MSALLKSYLPTQIIFREGLPGTNTYVVRSGKVEISIVRDGHKVILACIGEGASFGEMAPFDGGPRSATACAITPCDVWCIRSEGFREMVDSCPPLVKTLVDGLVARVRKLNTKIASSATLDSWLVTAHILDLLAKLRPVNNDSDSVVVPLKQVMERIPEVLGISSEDTQSILQEMQDAKLLSMTTGDNCQVVITQFRSFLPRARVALRIAGGRPLEAKESLF